MQNMICFLNAIELSDSWGSIVNKEYYSILTKYNRSLIPLQQDHSTLNIEDIFIVREEEVYSFNAKINHPHDGSAIYIFVLRSDFSVSLDITYTYKNGSSYPMSADIKQIYFCCPICGEDNISFPYNEIRLKTSSWSNIKHCSMCGEKYTLMVENNSSFYINFDENKIYQFEQDGILKKRKNISSLKYKHKLVKENVNDLNRNEGV